MTSDLWKKCINCKVNCCKTIVSQTLFITDEEKLKFPKINTTFPCKFLGTDNLCKIHKQRPIDCRLFPFDIAKIDNKFYWIYWKTNCLITKKGGQKEFEIYLNDIERNILPKFKQKDIEAYSQFRHSEFIDAFEEYTIVRELSYK